MRNSGEKRASQEQGAVPDLERASSSLRASSGEVFGEEDAAESVVANNTLVQAVIISEKEDPSSHGNEAIAVRQADDGDRNPQPQAPSRSELPSIVAQQEQQPQDRHETHDFASNHAGEEDSNGMNAKVMPMKDARTGNNGLVNSNGKSNTAGMLTSARRNRKSMILGILLCLVAVIGTIVALVVGLSGDDEQSDAFSFTDGANGPPTMASPSDASVPTSMPSSLPTPQQTPAPTSEPTEPPSIAEPRFCLQGSDTCGDGSDPFGFGADWQSLSCTADSSTLKCTIVACNEVFPIFTPNRVLMLVSPTTNQKIELYQNIFELKEGDELVYTGIPSIKSDKEVDIELPIAYFPNLLDIQVWLESSIFGSFFDPIDRLPDQITLSFSNC